MVFIILLNQIRITRKAFAFLVFNLVLVLPYAINAQNFRDGLSFTGGITFRTTAVTDFYKFDLIFPDDGTNLYNYEDNIQGFALNPGVLYNSKYWCIEYYPSLRYDRVRYLYNSDAVVREFIVDHNFNVGIHWKRLIYGVGMTIVNAGKEYYFVNPMPIIRHLDIEFNTYNAYIVFPIKPIYIEAKMLYIPRGLPQDPDGAYNMYSLKLFYNFSLNIFSKKENTGAPR